MISAGAMAWLKSHSGEYAREILAYLEERQAQDKYPGTRKN